MDGRGLLHTNSTTHQAGNRAHGSDTPQDGSEPKRGDIGAGNVQSIMQHILTSNIMLEVEDHEYILHQPSLVCIGGTMEQAMQRILTSNIMLEVEDHEYILH